MKIILWRRHAQIIIDRASSYEIDYFAVYYTSLAVA